MSPNSDEVVSPKSDAIAFAPRARNHYNSRVLRPQPEDLVHWNLEVVEKQARKKRPTVDHRKYGVVADCRSCHLQILGTHLNLLFAIKEKGRKCRLVAHRYIEALGGILSRLKVAKISHFRAKEAEWHCDHRRTT